MPEEMGTEKSKGEKIKELVIEAMKPAVRERMSVRVVKDRKGLTKVEARLKIRERAEGGTAVDDSL